MSIDGVSRGWNAREVTIERILFSFTLDDQWHVCWTHFILAVFLIPFYPCILLSQHALYSGGSKNCKNEGFVQSTDVSSLS